MIAATDADVAPRWQDELYDLLRANHVTQFAYVPDAGHRILIDRSLADPDAHSIALTTEEEGVALAAGAGIKRSMTIGAEHGEEFAGANFNIDPAQHLDVVIARVKLACGEQLAHAA